MTKDKYHWFAFFPAVWLQDPELCRCSLAARGAWMDLLCFMFESEERGVLVTAGVVWTAEDAACAVRGNQDVCLSGIEELTRCGVLRLRESDGAMYCARMVRERELSDTRAVAGRKGGLAKAKQTPSKQSSKHPSKSLVVTLSSNSNSSSKKKDVGNPRAWLSTDVLKTEAFCKAWSDWVAHRSEIGKSLKPTTVSRQLRRLEKWGHDRALEAIENSICNGWTGLFEPGKPAVGHGRVKAEPGKYDNLEVIHAPAKRPS